MKHFHFRTLAGLLLALGMGISSSRAAAPAAPQGLITGKLFSNITGTTIANLTGNPKFPNSPDDIFFFPYFEWAATGDIVTPPGNYSNNYGGQIAGYFYPPSTGNYIFWLAADDNAELYLSPDSEPANKKLIARETAWSNAREYVSSGGSSDLDSKDSSFFPATQWATTDPAGGAIITLQKGQPYYIEALFKEGGGGDFLSVAVQDPGFVIDITLPIPGDYLATDRTAGPASIASQPQSQTVDERGSVTFSALADGTPPYSYQWRRNGTAIADATGLSYTIASASVADNSAKYSVVVTGAQGTATSQDAVLTVTPDTIKPSLVISKGSPNLTEVALTFSEKLDPTSAGATANYKVSSASGTLNVTAAKVAGSGTQVILTTAQQTLGTKYTILINNVQDTAATPNTITPDTKSVFFPTGKLVEANGSIVFEAENYDRNLDDLWLRDTERGNPSGGASMVVPNGGGGNESGTKLEYDVDFKQPGIYRVWYRASGDNGNDDSSWFHLDGARPLERADGNSASMTGFSGALDFVWRSDSQSGPDPYTVEVLFPGAAVVALARREDGSYFDKFILTSDLGFTPTGFGPPETREGAPGTPTVKLTGPADGGTFATGSSITLSADAAGDSGLDISRVEYIANGTVIGEASASPFSFTWNNVPSGVFSIRARAIDEIAQSVTSTEAAVITVGTPPPQGLLVVGTDSNPTLNAADAGVKARLESMGWQVHVVQAPASTTADAEGKQLLMVSSTVNSGDVADKFRNSAVPVLVWEQALQDNFLMTLDTAADHGTLAGQTDLEIINPTHPLAGGVSAGVKTVTTEAQDYSWGVPNANATIIATVAGVPDQAVIYGYEKGAMLADDATPAPARRVMFFSGNNGYAAFTDDARSLFDAAIVWASGIEPQTAKPTSANIAWVSFHAGDDAPSGDAATAGFTKAADVAYTDLLKANGHNVTRIVTSGTPDTALLNAFDLVIISRSVPSGDYQDASESAAWNGIKAPTLILGGYILRSSRLGFTEGSTMVDTDRPVQLTVTDPSHPIFSGIKLDTANTTVNPYADVVSFAGTVQRGVSINTDPVAGGGNVLASIGTTEDPTFGGMVIGEWQAGASLANGSADTLGGHRLVFLTGSREQGITSQGAGIFDLTEDGTQMFLNAVNYMAGTEPGSGGGPGTAPALSFARTATGLSITFSGTLQSAGSINGPWTDEAGASSPFAVNTTAGTKFYRAKQ